MIKTLLVDDDPLFRDLVKATLKKLFPEMIVQEAGNAGEAMSRAETLHPDLVFTDISLPGENGLKLTERLKKAYPEIVVIILSGHDAPEYYEAALARGASRFVTKDSLKREEIEAFIRSVFPEV
jgi:DNA-binding NarL/FixJ family response regulator